MDSTEPSGRFKRLGSALLGAGLAAFSIRSFRKGNRLRGAVTSVGAIALGYAAVKGTDSTGEEFDVETTGGETSTDTETVSTTVTDTDESAADTSPGLTCAACGEPITTGQRRRPNEDDETVHDDCL
ncbi:DUF2892 domain-containing protein [Halorientalis salina]|uniref:DUF2892 domain-containing protein n=1 Tax=Halorientalis salina TaxID=2932266 RepID=UPI0010AC78F4|nr:DUF2892 domain-containing protein [Halorientalis salina]